MRASFVALIAVVLLAISANVEAAQLYWDGGGADSNWGNPLNWSDQHVLDGPGTGGVNDNRVPNAGDELSLDGNAVTVSSVEQYNDFNPSAPNTGGGLTINAGGYLSTGGGFHGLFGLNLGVVINSGGTLFNDPNTTNEQIRSGVTINTGGVMEGFDTLRTTMNIAGGTFRPGNQATPITFNITSGSLNLNSGVLELDLFDGTGTNNETINLSAGTTLNINNPAGEVVLVPQGSYIPVPGDSFDLWDGTGTINFLADASNISIQGYDYQWDTSLFASQGILSIAIPPVPEPSSVCLLGLGALVMLRRTRRRDRKA